MIASPTERLSDGALAQLRARFAERAAEHDRNGSFPFENFELLHEHGLLALTVPREFGGAGASLGTAARIVREVALCLASYCIGSHHAVLFPFRNQRESALVTTAPRTGSARCRRQRRSDQRAACGT